ncbi:MAG: serine--tRNA ligase, partial [Syntrophaceae bacterium]|nr:serine--tRNA ligase [Syntrophaceae bacterium]
MLDIRFVRENIDFVQKKLAQRGQDTDLGQFSRLDQERRDILKEVEALRSERNAVSKEVGQRKKQKEDASDLISKMGAVSARIKELDESLKETEALFDDFLMTIPNVPHESVVSGTDSADNPIVREWGGKPVFTFEPKPHWETGEFLKVLDFAGGAKIAGARFTLYRGLGARLERALINFMIDLHAGEHGYTEVLPPFMVNSDSLRGTGQLPKFEEDLFKIEGTDYYLIPTAEVPVTNIHRGDILDGKDLPVYYVAYTPCFRAEAGSYGKDTRGLIRQHQFNKVEMVKFSKPDTSYDELEKLTANAEEVLKRLNIHFRTVDLCAGDLGFSSAKTYDIEAWMPGQDAYREISSCSNFEDFQARRINVRYRDENKKVRFVHTLNGSGLALPRTMIA